MEIVMKKKSKIFLGTLAVAGVYSAVTGKGVFNKWRFKDQHNAVSRYVKGHYPNSVYTPITASGDGWATVILRPGYPKVFLYITRSDDGMYIFHETKINK